MSPNFLRIAASLFVVIAFAGVVSGCGRRGGLERPPYAQALAAEEDGTIAAPAYRKPFILDPLID